MSYIEDITWPRGDTKFLFGVLKNMSRVSAANEWNIFQHDYYINTNEILNNFTKGVISICNHSNSDLFTCDDNMLFSRVKISCFRAKAHLVFHWCLYNKWTYYVHAGHRSFVHLGTAHFALLLICNDCTTTPTAVEDPKANYSSRVRCARHQDLSIIS